MLDSDTVPNGFRQLHGLPNYAIDESGTILSVCNGRGKIRPWDKARRLKPSTAKDGYRRVCLSHNGREQTALVHTLVLTAFVGPRPTGMECRHIDGCKTNNHVSNLAWGTSSENHHDKLLHGTRQWGEQATNVKLKTNDVLEIRRRAANGECITDIAKDFPVDQPAIYKIISRKRWKHV